MPLTFSGKEGTSDKFELMLEAYDGDQRVVVFTSTEAIEDHGLSAVQRKASEKYDEGDRIGEFNVRVHTTDF